MDILAQAVLRGERRALARLLTQVENDTPTGRQALDELFAHTGKAHLIGVTGPSGTGKSTLVNSLVVELLAQAGDVRVAVVAVDPSSPFTGGAVLGDRIRMRSIVENPSVFIRSMASRGALGGLAHSTQAVCLALDAAGFDYIVIETVGAGQTEVEVARLAHSVIVVEAPGLGDDVQAAKAGILEIADILALNKADRPGVEATAMALEAMLAMGYPFSERTEAVWVPPVVRTIATDGDGVDELVKMMLEHETFLKANGDWQKRDQSRLQYFIRGLLERRREREWNHVLEHTNFQSLLKRVFTRELSPYAAIERYQD